MVIPHVFFGTLREHYILLFGSAGAFGLAAGFVGSWVGAHFSARRALRRAHEEQGIQQNVSLQLAPLMQALDAISLEVERISEAQRFTTRVLSERQQPPALKAKSESRSITPH